MVEYLSYKDKKLPVRVSYYALTKYKEETGEEFDQASMGKEGKSLSMFEPVMYYALESGHRALGIPFEIDRKTDMFEILEECFFQFVNIISKFFPTDDLIEKKDLAPAVGNRAQRRAIKK